MIATLIFVISFLTLLQFFVSYSRSVIAELRGHELSEQARELCGLTAKTVAGEQFRRLQQLIALCPETGGDGFEVRAVALYFRLLGLVRNLLSGVIPSAAPWIEAERGGCAYAAAVVLDRRIAYSRMMMRQQTSPEL
jgi:CBS domain containing-hemolysin-like protein